MSQLKCNKHNWQLLMPLAEDVDIKDKVLYCVDLTIRKTLGTAYYCPACMKVGFKIKSHRGGIRLANQPQYLIIRANEMRTQYGINQIKHLTHKP